MDHIILLWILQWCGIADFSPVGLWQFNFRGNTANLNEKNLSTNSTWVFESLFDTGNLNWYESEKLLLSPREFSKQWLQLPMGQNIYVIPILLRLWALKWPRSKIEFFNPKKVKISNSELQKCYIPQKKAKNMYNKNSTRKSKMSVRPPTYLTWTIVDIWPPT